MGSKKSENAGETASFLKMKNVHAFLNALLYCLSYALMTAEVELA